MSAIVNGLDRNTAVTFEFESVRVLPLRLGLIDRPFGEADARDAEQGGEHVLFASE